MTSSDYFTCPCWNMFVVVAYTLCHVIAVYPLRHVRLSYRMAQDVLLLVAGGWLLGLTCCQLVGCPLLALVAWVMYMDLPGPHLTVEGRAVLVTGCDHGLGQALALRLDSQGFQVFAGCLMPDGQGSARLQDQASSRLQVVPLDVTSPEQVTQAVEFVTRQLKGKELHGVVNNAGILMAGPLEVMTLQDIQKVMEVNYFGTVRVCRAFLPLLRQQRSEKRTGSTARLVNVASNIGLAPANMTEAYGASKAAVALLSETLRYELRPLGIQVSTIVPSGFKTGILQFDRQAARDRWWAQASQEVRDFYGHECFLLQEKRGDAAEFLSPDFSPVVGCMEDALLSSNPRPFYYKGLLARSWPFLYGHLPSPLWDRLMPLLADHYRFPVRALADCHSADRHPADQEKLCPDSDHVHSD